MLGIAGYVVGFLGIFLIAYWVFDERDQSENMAETIENVGERAQTVTGGVFGAAGSLGVVAVSIVITVGNELTMSSMRIVELVSTDPVLSGGVATGLTGVAANAGLLGLSTMQLLGLVAAFLIIGTVWRERQT